MAISQGSKIEVADFDNHGTFTCTSYYWTSGSITGEYYGKLCCLHIDVTTQHPTGESPQPIGGIPAAYAPAKPSGTVVWRDNSGRSAMLSNASEYTSLTNTPWAIVAHGTDSTARHFIGSLFYIRG